MEVLWEGHTDERDYVSGFPVWVELPQAVPCLERRGYLNVLVMDLSPVSPAQPHAALINEEGLLGSWVHGEEAERN